MNSMPGDKACQELKDFWKSKDPFNVSDLSNDIDLSNHNIVGAGILDENEELMEALNLDDDGVYYGQVKKVDGF